MLIYVASSWRNQLQPEIVSTLRGLGHEVYDFRNPAPGSKGFAWSDIDPNWQHWTPEEYRAALQHPIAKAGYALDIGALRACDACVLVLPSGRSASWELGYAMGQGKRAYVYQQGEIEPELMYREARILTSRSELIAAFSEAAAGGDAMTEECAALAVKVDARVRRVLAGCKCSAIMDADETRHFQGCPKREEKPRPVRHVVRLGARVPNEEALLVLSPRSEEDAVLVLHPRDEHGREMLSKLADVVAADLLVSIAPPDAEIVEGKVVSNG